MCRRDNKSTTHSIWTTFKVLIFVILKCEVLHYASNWINYEIECQNDIVILYFMTTVLKFKIINSESSPSQSPPPPPL